MVNGLPYKARLQVPQSILLHSIWMDSILSDQHHPNDANDRWKCTTCFAPPVVHHALGERALSSKHLGPIPRPPRRHTALKEERWGSLTMALSGLRKSSFNSIPVQLSGESYDAHSQTLDFSTYETFSLFHNDIVYIGKWALYRAPHPSYAREDSVYALDIT